MASEQAVGTEASSTSEKSPIVAAVLSLVIPGVGQYYNGDTNRGLIVFGAVLVYYILSTVLIFVGIGILMLFAVPVVHIIAAIDAFVQANSD